MDYLKSVSVSFLAYCGRPPREGEAAEDVGILKQERLGEISSEV